MQRQARETGAQADLSQAPVCARLQHTHAMLRYMRTLACRVLDVEALLLWEQEVTLGAAAVEREASAAEQEAADAMAAAEAQEAGTGRERRPDADADAATGLRRRARRYYHKSVQTSPTERSRLHDVFEAHKLVQVYERCYQMMLEEMRRACVACGGAGCGEGGGSSGGGGCSAGGTGCTGGAGGASGAGGTSGAVCGGGGASGSGSGVAAGGGSDDVTHSLSQRNRRGWRRIFRGVFARSPSPPPPPPPPPPPQQQQQPAQDK